MKEVGADFLLVFFFFDRKRGVVDGGVWSRKHGEGAFCAELRLLCA